MPIVASTFWYPFDIVKAKQGYLIGVLNEPPPNDDDEEEEEVPAEPVVEVQSDPDPEPEPEPGGEGGEGGEGEGGDDSEQPGYVSTSTDLTYTGLLIQPDSSPFYHASLGGYLVEFDRSGYILSCPTNPDLVGEQLYIVVKEIPATTNNNATRADGGSSVNLDSLQVRDEIATSVLNGLLNVRGGAGDYSDGAMLALCKTSYRWAQAMMMAGAEYRAAEQATEDPTPNNNTEQYLQNIAHSISALSPSSSAPKLYEVSDIEAISSSTCDDLHAGDVVVKNESDSRHTYVVVYKQDNEMSLVYADRWNIEEVYYEKSGGTWSHIVTDIVSPVDESVIGDINTILDTINGEVL